ncbi:MAG: flagellar basal body P-ring protein FlgI, partial [Pseudomonadota bacterium]
DGGGLSIVEDTVSLASLVEGLNALGVGTRDMIDILSAIKAAGALHAEFVLQ